MKITSDTLLLPPIQYESRATCIEGYAYPNSSYNKKINAQGIHVLCLENVCILGVGYLVDVESWTPVFAHQELLFFPRYVSKWYIEKKRQRLIYALLNTKKTDLTCLNVDSVINVLHFNYHVYGHFLLEIIPKLFILKDYFKKTAKNSAPPIAIPSNVKTWVVDYILEIWPECNILRFDPKLEFVVAEKTFVVAGDRLEQHPSIAHFFLSFGKENGSALISGKPVTHTTEQFFGFGDALDTRVKKRKILLIRPKMHISRRIMVNFTKIKNIAVKKGYEVVEPKSLASLKEQAVFFSQCSVVLGEFTSALHNTVFCPSGTIVGCLNYVNHYQESIASVIGHNLNYVLPNSGPVFKGLFQFYRIPELKFAQLIDDIEKNLDLT